MKRGWGVQRSILSHKPAQSLCYSCSSLWRCRYVNIPQYPDLRLSSSSTYRSFTTYREEENEDGQQLPETIIATKNGHINTLSSLLQCNPSSIHDATEFGETALHFAFSLDVAAILVAAGIDINKRNQHGVTPLHNMALNNAVEAMKLLVEHGANVNSADNDGRTPLHGALSPQAAEILLSHGAQLDARDKKAWTPLHLLSSLGAEQSVELLLRHGADANARSTSQHTPLHLAKTGEIAKSLLQRGADINATHTVNSRTPLHDLVLLSKDSSVEILLQHGADPNTKDAGGYTPLHFARASTIASLLIQYGGNVNALSNTHSTPLHVLSINGADQSCELLLKHGAHVNARDNKGSTPLHGAKTKEVASVLIANGADVHAKNNSGVTAMQRLQSLGLSLS